MNLREALTGIRSQTCVQCGKQAKGFKTTGKKIMYYCKDCLYRIPKINNEAYVLLPTQVSGNVTDAKFASTNCFAY